MLNEGVQLIHFDGLDRLWHRSWRELGGMSIDPVRHALMVDAQMACNSSQIHPIHIQLHRFQPGFVAVSRLFRFRGVVSQAVLALIALRPGVIVPPRFDLSGFFCTVGTFHLTSLSSICV